MPAAYRLALGEEERITLAEMREQAAAVRKVANGLSIRQVADVGERLRAARLAGLVFAVRCGSGAWRYWVVRQARVAWRAPAGGWSIYVDG